MIGTPLTWDVIGAEVAGLRIPPEAVRGLRQSVAQLVEAVEMNGDRALVEATVRFDWPEASTETLRVPVEAIENAGSEVAPELLEALRVARDNCRLFHEQEISVDWEAEAEQGQRVGIRHLPVGRVGLYVPGGIGSYASSVVMNVVPAQVAGVEQIFICTPPDQEGGVSKSVLAAADMLGVHEVYRVGGAQAVAAMAFGTESIRRADVISGPGNAYVTEAKRQVFGTVGIDGLAGPSEVLIVADDSARPDWVAADLLAQAEHGSGAVGILISEPEGFGVAVSRAIGQLQGRVTGTAPADDLEVPPVPAGIHLYRSEVADFRGLATNFVNEYAPEHLELHVREPRSFLRGIKCAGAVFIGRGTPTAFGDYVAGSNHVLPTGGAARFSSGLSVYTFMRCTSLVEVGPESAARLSPYLTRIAESEGFVFHGLSAEMRVGRESGESLCDGK